MLPQVGVDRMHFGDGLSAVGLEVLEKQDAKAPERRGAELKGVGLEIPEKQDAEAPKERC